MMMTSQPNLLYLHNILDSIAMLGYAMLSYAMLCYNTYSGYTADVGEYWRVYIYRNINE